MNREWDVVANSGLYQLVIQLRGAHVIRVGRLGRFSFPEGYYVYTGSAKRGLEQRIARHTRSKKRMRWHIDYLLRLGRVVAVKRYSGSLSECELNGRVMSAAGSEVIVRGFGSSDCKCSSHMIHFRSFPRFRP